MRTKTSPITVIFNIFKYVVLILAAVIALVPVCVCILTAFKTTDEYNASSVLDLPKTFALKTLKLHLHRLICFADLSTQHLY